MKTIAVHSYKGGTGRTLLVTQLAIALGRLRKSVVVVDLDVDSPGLLHRFQSLFNFVVPANGLVRHATDFEATGTLPSLRPYTVTVAAGLHILGPGNAFERHGYWRELLQLQSFERNSAAPYFRQLKRAIEKDIGPDYLLLDAPSGLSRLVGFASTLMADMVCCLSTFELDSLQGTNLIVRENEELIELQQTVTPTRIVLTRYPEYYEGENSLVRATGLATALEEARATITSRLKRPSAVGPLLTIRSEPRLQMGEGTIPIPLRGSPLRSGVVKDYCRVFGELIPELASRFDEMKADVPEIRTFNLNEESGKMINPADNSWNVAFRVDTLLGFVDSLVANAGAPAEVVADALHRAGYAAAANFSEFLREAWAVGAKGGKATVAKRLQEWCGFDSRVGFGRFEGHLLGRYSGEVVVTNNFLIAERTPKDLNLCGFMSGYICRILEVLYPDRVVKVTHDLRSDCGQYSRAKTQSACRFLYFARLSSSAEERLTRSEARRPRTVKAKTKGVTKRRNRA